MIKLAMGAVLGAVTTWLVMSLMGAQSQQSKGSELPEHKSISYLYKASTASGEPTFEDSVIATFTGRTDWAEKPMADFNCNKFVEMLQEDKGEGELFFCSPKKLGLIK